MGTGLEVASNYKRKNQNRHQRFPSKSKTNKKDWNPRFS
jgi:hypothetical protein